MHAKLVLFCLTASMTLAAAATGSKGYVAVLTDSITLETWARTFAERRDGVESKSRCAGFCSAKPGCSHFSHGGSTCYLGDVDKVGGTVVSAGELQTVYVNEVVSINL